MLASEQAIEVELRNGPACWFTSLRVSMNRLRSPASPPFTSFQACGKSGTLPGVGMLSVTASTVNSATRLRR